MRHRDHQFPARRRAVLARLDDGEYGDIKTAAARVGLTPSGFVAVAAVAAARAEPPPVSTGRREVLQELMQARAQLRRFGVLLNQAVAAFHAMGVAPVWLGRAVVLCNRAVLRVDAAAADLVRQR